MGVDRLVASAESVARALRQLAELERRQVPPRAGRARLLERWADVLEVAARGIVAPEDATPPGGTWLGDVLAEIGDGAHWVTPAAIRWLLRRLVEARTLVSLMSAAAQFAGDLELVAAAERWRERIDEGPPRDT